MVAGPLLAPPPGRDGWDRIVAGARFLSDLDPGWWREDALPPASLAALDMADPLPVRACLLGRPAPPRPATTRPASDPALRPRRRRT